jgi:hypothetical protein
VHTFVLQQIPGPDSSSGQLCDPGWLPDLSNPWLSIIETSTSCMGSGLSIKWDSAT